MSATATTTSTIPITTSTGYFAPPSNALQAYLYPALALACGVALTIVVCRVIDRRRRGRRADAAAQRAEARLAETLSSQPEMYDVAIEKQGSPYAAHKSQSYLWADLTPLSGTLTCRGPQTAGLASRRNPPSRRRNPLLSAELGLSLLRDAFPLPAHWRREPTSTSQPFTEPATALPSPPPYDTIVAGVMIAMPSDRSALKVRDEAPDDDQEEQLPELVLGCAESDWRP